MTAASRMCGPPAGLVERRNERIAVLGRPLLEAGPAEDGALLTAASKTWHTPHLLSAATSASRCSAVRCLRRPAEDGALLTAASNTWHTSHLLSAAMSASRCSTAHCLRLGPWKMAPSSLRRSW